MNNLIHITMTIYDPGYKHNEDQLMDGGGHDFWLTPVPRQSQYLWQYRHDPLDCVRPLRLDERDSWATKLDVIFDKWAVGFDFVDLPLLCKTGHGYKSPVDYERWHMGMDRFAEFAWDIVEMFDEMIELLPSKIDKWDNPHIHQVSGITLWTYESWRCNHPLDPEEWDDGWVLDGLLKNPFDIAVWNPSESAVQS